MRQRATSLRGFVDAIEELRTIGADSVVKKVVDALHFEKVCVDVIEKKRVEHLAEHERSAGVLPVLDGAFVGGVRSRQPNDQQAIHA